MQVVQPSCAANYFHLLRTQMRLPFRKPLIVIAPKKLLRLKGATSELSEFAEGTRWLPLIGDQYPKLNAPHQVKKVVFCCGQVYYDLEAERAKNNRSDVAIVRTESLCPFPFKEVRAEMEKYKNAKVMWAQEEPKNAGPWSYMQPRLRNVLKHLGRKDANINYAGRPMMGAPAVGFTETHVNQLDQLVKEAFK